MSDKNNAVPTSQLKQQVKNIEQTLGTNSANRKMSKEKLR